MCQEKAVFLLCVQAWRQINGLVLFLCLQVLEALRSVPFVTAVMNTGCNGVADQL